jgi:hypothetical protein
MRPAHLALLSTTLAVLAAPAVAQDATAWWEGELPGAALGAFSGAMTGSLGSILPCTQTTLGRHCVNAVTALGATVGLTAGAVVGHRSPDRLDDLAQSAAIGLAAGALVGLGARPYAQRFGLVDVLTVGLVGAAIGSQPRPALVGFAVGGVTGLAVWQSIPGIELPDVAAAALTGVLVGVWTGWIMEATDVEPVPGTGLAPTLSVRIPLGR